VAANMNGALGSQIIADVQALTGYEPTAVAAVFMELAEQGIVERSISDPASRSSAFRAGSNLSPKL